MPTISDPIPGVNSPPACDVCGLPSVVLLANDAPLTSSDYREWYACRWHQRSVLAPTRPGDGDA